MPAVPGTKHLIAVVAVTGTVVFGDLAFGAEIGGQSPAPNPEAGMPVMAPLLVGNMQKISPRSSSPALIALCHTCGGRYPVFVGYTYIPSFNDGTHHYGHIQVLE